MALTNFFRINFPYGISKNENGDWIAFNREYMPLGFSDTKTTKDLTIGYLDIPIGSNYSGLNDKFISALVNEPKDIQKNDSGEIVRFFLYDDGSNPCNSDNKSSWDSYFLKLKKLGLLNRKR